MKGKKQPASLGKSLIRDRKLSRNANKNWSSQHTTDLQDGYDWARLNINSVTEETSLEEFLTTAELAGTEFTAERLNAKIVSGIIPSGILTKEEKLAVDGAQESNKHLLRIPRRPHWDASTSKEELIELEKDSFLKWRRQLSQLQQVEHIVLTPYEKNLEFWRQLWRVIERSDIVVQIVDARNPLLFWCSDLETYIKEVNPCKIPVTLLNKSDFLTLPQREMWAEYFNKRGQLAIFFSALQQNENFKEMESDSNEDEGNSTEDEKESDSNEDQPSNTEDKKELDSNEDQGTEDKNSELIERLEINAKQDKLEEDSLMTTTDLLTTKELLALFKRLHHKQKVKEGITTVGLVGYPNVGKSSTINALLHCKKVSVSATPGKTKHFQTIVIDPGLILCDCPGLVFPNFVSTKAEMIISGILSIDNLTDPISPTSLITSMIPRHILQSVYKIFLPVPCDEEDPNRPPTAEELLNAYGYMRGFLTHRGLPDISRSARYILKDFVNGKLVYCRAPPEALQSDYHIFPSDAETSASAHNITPSQARILKAGKITSSDVDKEFFAKGSSKAHYKPLALQSISTTNSNLSLKEKPWKKHNNRKKKEKLRRLYSELDK